MTPEQQAREDAENFPPPTPEMTDRLSALFRPAPMESGSNAA